MTMRIAFWIPKATDTHIDDVQYSLLFHFNNGCTDVRQCFVLLTLPVLLKGCCGFNVH